MIIGVNQVLWLARIWLCIALVSATAILGRAADNSRESQADDIREAVFRYQFEHNASGQQQSAHDYYLAIGDQDADPSDEFMKRFAHHKPPVHKASASRMMEDLGVDYIVHHTGFDERNGIAAAGGPRLSPLDELDAVVNAVSIPVQAVGGLTIEEAIEMPKLGAPLVVIGAPLAIDSYSFSVASGDLMTLLVEITRRIRG